MNDWTRRLSANDVYRAALAARSYGPELTWGKAIINALEAALPERYGLFSFLESCAESVVRPRSPFAGYLEAPRAVVELHEVHGQRLHDLDVDLAHACADVLTDACERLLDGTALSWGDLAKHGVTEITQPPPPESDWD